MPTKMAKIRSGLLIIALFLLPIMVHGADTSKIYKNGKWQTVKSSEEFSAWNTSFLGGTKAPIDIANLALRFLKDNSSPWENLSVLWKTKNITKGNAFETARLERHWNGLEILGGEGLVHVSGNKIELASYDDVQTDQLNQSTNISPRTAEALAFASYQGKPVSHSPAKLLVLSLKENDQRIGHLAYEITVRDRNHLSSDIFYVDAQTGNQLLTTTNVFTLVNRKVMAGTGTDADFDLDEKLWPTVLSDSPCPTSAQEGRKNLNPPNPCAAVDERFKLQSEAAYLHSGLIYNYFKKSHGRESIDNSGMQINSVVNFGDDSFTNAAWIADKKIMVYGNGGDIPLRNGSLLRLNDFASSLDVAAHEVTHGVTSSTANLQYISESGALNESYSDVFAKLISFQNGKLQEWKLGRDLFKEGNQIVRNMEEPEIGHYKNFRYKGAVCTGENDHCGVHDNSGIPNRAAVLLAQKIGLNNLGILYFTVLTQMLKPTSDFKEAKAQTEVACTKVFAPGTVDCSAITKSFEEVGI